MKNPDTKNVAVHNNILIILNILIKANQPSQKKNLKDLSQEDLDHQLQITYQENMQLE